ncbi:MAG: matrixin family metalloprotease [Rubrobacteraceae bacterium]|jgi:hypothetical protein
MIGQVTTCFPLTGTTRRMFKLSIIGLIVALVAALATANAADASDGYSPVDSDGYVPVYSTCFAGSEVGYYNWYSDGYTVSGTIYINDCYLQSLGAGPNDRVRVVEHEMGHAQGLPHSSDPNSVMYPVYVITGT